MSSLNMGGLSPVTTPPGTPPGSGLVSGVPTNWAINPDMKRKYARLFQKQDPGRTGFVQAEPGRDLLMKSKLSTATLQQVWALCDQDNDAALNLNEFMVAVHLCSLLRKGATLQGFLPPELQEVIDQPLVDPATIVEGTRSTSPAADWLTSSRPSSRSPRAPREASPAAARRAKESGKESARGGGFGDDAGFGADAGFGGFGTVDSGGDTAFDSFGGGFDSGQPSGFESGPKSAFDSGGFGKKKDAFGDEKLARSERRSPGPGARQETPPAFGDKMSPQFGEDRDTRSPQFGDVIRAGDTDDKPIKPSRMLDKPRRTYRSDKELEGQITADILVESDKRLARLIRQDVDELEAELKHVSDACRRVQRETSQLQREANRHAQHRSDLEKRLDEVRMRHKELSADRQQASLGNISLARDRQHYAAELVFLRTVAQAHQEDIDGYRTMIGSLETSFRNGDAVVQGLERQRKDLQQQVQEEKDRIKKIEHENAEQQTQYDQMVRQEQVHLTRRSEQEEIKARIASFQSSSQRPAPGALAPGIERDAAPTQHSWAFSILGK